jgi:hypothetical protein
LHEIPERPTGTGLLIFSCQLKTEVRFPTEEIDLEEKKGAEADHLMV